MPRESFLNHHVPVKQVNGSVDVMTDVLSGSTVWRYMFRFGLVLRCGLVFRWSLYGCSDLVCSDLDHSFWIQDRRFT